MDTLALYEKYLEEREKKSLYADPEGRGFLTYRMNDEACYIIDLYVLPEFRHLGIAKAMADIIASDAVKRGCKFLHGSVSPHDPNITENMKVLLAYGMNFSHYTSDLIFFAKELGE